MTSTINKIIIFNFIENLQCESTSENHHLELKTNENKSLKSHKTIAKNIKIRLALKHVNLIKKSL